jgi:hypothetical protein
MSLFGNLFRLHSDEHRRLEDFHSEIVAHVLASDSELTLRWLQELGVTELHGADEIAVSTQQAFESIEGLHTTGSKPDVTIRVRKGSRVEVVFIESKVGSEESQGQLSKYMDQLRALPGVDRRSLVFVTRDYEPKELLLDKTVEFFPTRWSDFYHFLRTLESPSDTILELLKFMKENNMSQSNRFTPIELLALTNHHRARSLMDATMWENVVKKFEKVCGATSSATKAMTQLRKHNRYVMIAGHGDGYQIECFLGYMFPDEQPSDSPEVGICILVNPKAVERPAISRGMLEFTEATKGAMREWYHWELGNDRTWAGIGCTKNLEDFLAKEDHVAAISNWFEELLDDAAAFRSKYPKLPWSFRATEGDDEC